MYRRGIARATTFCFVVLGIWLYGTPRLPVAGLQVTSQQRRELSSIRTSLRRAALLREGGKTDEAAKLARQSQEQLVAMLKGADANLIEQAKLTYDSLSRLRGELEFEGISLPPLEPLNAMAGSASSDVSFVKAVVPILVGKCGRCHVQRAQGQFSMATFQTLAKGTPAGVVFFPKDADGSRLIEVIESGDMPRGGQKLSEEELATLKGWIQAGARFDGDDPGASLASLAGKEQTGDPPAVELTMSQGTETVLFSRDIAPVLAEACANCHGNGQQVRARFNLTTFRNMVRGGDSGPAWVPGKSAESLLWQKLKGTADGERMPSGQSPLSDEVIERFATWIDEGATFDGPNVNQNVAEIAAVSKALLASHDQLSADRARLAEQNWRLVMPETVPDRVASADFLLLGNVGDISLAEYASLAESLVPRVGKLFRLPAGQPLIKGRMTLYFLNRQYDYGEFGQMVEKRGLPSAWRGHWRHTTVDAYGVIHPPADDQDALASLLAEQIAGVHVASRGVSPPWFSQGAGRVAAANFFPRDRRVRSWTEQLPEVLSRMRKPDDFLTGNLDPEEASVAAFSFVSMLMSDSRRFQLLLGNLGESVAFEEAFRQAFGDTPAKVAEIWVGRATKASGADAGDRIPRHTLAT